jgi:hypothetical protein
MQRTAEILHRHGWYVVTTHDAPSGPQSLRVFLRDTADEYRVRVIVLDWQGQVVAYYP